MYPIASSAFLYQGDKESLIKASEVFSASRLIVKKPQMITILLNRVAKTFWLLFVYSVPLVD